MSMVRGTSCGSRTRLVVHEQQGDDHHHRHVDHTSYRIVIPVVESWNGVPRGNLERPGNPGALQKPRPRPTWIQNNRVSNELNLKP